MERTPSEDRWTTELSDDHELADLRSIALELNGRLDVPPPHIERPPRRLSIPACQVGLAGPADR